MRAHDERVQVVDADLLAGRDRDDLLREHVERVARDPRLLDLALAHRARDDRALEQVGAELREDPPLRDRAQLVAGAADPLQPARDRLRRLDLDDQVDGAHVDPELEARGGHQAGDAARLQILLDDARAARAPASRDGRGRSRARRARSAAARAARPAAGCSRRRSSSGAPRPAPKWPDRSTARSSGRRVRSQSPSPGRRRERAGRATRSSRARACRRRARRPRGRAPCACRRRPARSRRPPATNRPISSSGRWVALRPMRWNGLLDDPLEALDGQREMGAALGAGDRVHLVEDQRLDAPQRLARLRREQQVERLRRRDQDVGRLLHHLPALLGRRVAGADGNPQARLEPCERPAQVALDVVVERLQRRDVEDAQTLARRRGSAGRSPRETRRASCRSRSAPGSARARPRRSPATRAPAPVSARRTCARTRPASRARMTARSSPGPRYR